MGPHPAGRQLIRSQGSAAGIGPVQLHSHFNLSDLLTELYTEVNHFISPGVPSDAKRQHSHARDVCRKRCCEEIPLTHASELGPATC